MGQQTKKGYKLDQDGQKVQDLLDKVDALGLVSSDKDGLMASSDKELLDARLTAMEIDELVGL